METLPCGCNIGTDIINGVKTFLYEPCSLTCKYYLYVVEQTKKQGKEVKVIDAR